ncbi:hypothetical protein [Bauldia litoralis]|uniref:hypothetical protein n=1 Tax=Bauldia litoralis TaxID=665467 RepID=UPI0032660559
MSYSKAPLALVFPLLDFGAGGRTDRFKLPKGKGATLIDYGVQSIQETFAGGTPATIAVGLTGNTDAYGEELSLGAAATTTVGGYTIRSLYGQYDETNLDLFLVDPYIPADTAILLTSVAAGGGSEAGQAYPYLVLKIDD